MASDPTAKAAMKNVGGQERAAVIKYHEDGVPAYLWMDNATFKKLSTLVFSFTDDNGQRHIRFQEPKQ